MLHLLFEPYFYANWTQPSREASRTGKKLPPTPPVGRLRAFTACCFAYKVDDATFIECAGVDAFAFVEYLKCSLRVLTLFAIWALSINTAFYYSNTHAVRVYALEPRFLTVAPEGPSFEFLVLPQNPAVPEAFLSRSSIVYIDSLVDGEGAWDQWAAFIFSLLGMWVCSLHGYYQLVRSWQRLVRACQTSMADAGDAASHTLLVRAINPLAKPFEQNEAFALWAGLYPNQIFSVRMCRDTRELPKAVAKFDKLQAQLKVLEVKNKNLREKAAAAEAAEAAGDAAEGAAKVSAVSKLCACCRTPPLKAAEKLAPKLVKTREALEEARLALQKAAVANCGEERDEGLSYFVLLKSARAATIAKQVCGREAGPGCARTRACGIALSLSLCRSCTRSTPVLILVGRPSLTVCDCTAPLLLPTALPVPIFPVPCVDVR